MTVEPLTGGQANTVFAVTFLSSEHRLIKSAR